MSKDLQTVNGENKLNLWAERVAACRNSGMTVREFCRNNGISEPTYYKWQKKLFILAQREQEESMPRFVRITPPRLDHQVAVTIRMSDTEIQIHNGADAATMEAVLRIFKLC